MRQVRHLNAIGLIACTFLPTFYRITDNNQKSFCTVTYYYKDNCPQKILKITGHENSTGTLLTCDELTNASNWSKIMGSSFRPGSFILAINFNEDKDEDGSNDAELTLSEALSALCTYYLAQSPNQLPSNGGVINVGKAEITVFRKATDL